MIETNPPKPISVHKKYGDLYCKEKCGLWGPFPFSGYDEFSEAKANSIIAECRQPKRPKKIKACVVADAMKFHKKYFISSKPPIKDVRFENVIKSYHFEQKDTMIILAVNLPSNSKQIFVLDFKTKSQAVDVYKKLQYAAKALNHNLKNRIPPDLVDGSVSGRISQRSYQTSPQPVNTGDRQFENQSLNHSTSSTPHISSPKHNLPVAEEIAVKSSSPVLSSYLSSSSSSSTTTSSKKSPAESNESFKNMLAPSVIAQNVNLQNTPVELCELQENGIHEREDGNIKTSSSNSLEELNHKLTRKSSSLSKSLSSSQFSAKSNEDLMRPPPRRTNRRNSSPIETEPFKGINSLLIITSTKGDDKSTFSSSRDRLMSHKSINAIVQSSEQGNELEIEIIENEANDESVFMYSKTEPTEIYSFNRPRYDRARNRQQKTSQSSRSSSSRSTPTDDIGINKSNGIVHVSN